MTTQSIPTPSIPERIAQHATVELWDRALRAKRILLQPEIRTDAYEFHCGRLEGYLQALSLLLGREVSEIRTAVSAQARA